MQPKGEWVSLVDFRFGNIKKMILGQLLLNQVHKLYITPLQHPHPQISMHLAYVLLNLIVLQCYCVDLAMTQYAALAAIIGANGLSKLLLRRKKHLRILELCCKSLGRIVESLGIIPPI